jgi:hypothetical protein
MKIDPEEICLAKSGGKIDITRNFTGKKVGFKMIRVAPKTAGTFGG